MKVPVFLLAASLFIAPRVRAADPVLEDTTATVIEVSGEVLYEAAAGVFKPVVLGQLFAEGDHLITRSNSGLHLVLADGSSIVLGPSSEMTLEKIGAGEEGSQTFLQLLKGTADAIVQKLKLGSAFELRTQNAVAAVKGTQFEVSDDGSTGSVLVREGVVAMSDLERINVVRIPAMNKASVNDGNLERPSRMSFLEANAFEQRWAHARMIHEHRAEIIKPLERNLLDRRAVLELRKPELLRRLRLKSRSKESLGRRVHGHNSRKKLAAESGDGIHPVNK